MRVSKYRRKSARPMWNHPPAAASVDSGGRTCEDMITIERVTYKPFNGIREKEYNVLGGENERKCQNAVGKHIYEGRIVSKGDVRI